jgi:DNA excision repair protein ERCC-4
MIILTDTREQQPFTFTSWPDVAIERGTLATGDYSLAGFESVIACERKELNDLIACLQNGNRERFEKELARGAALHHFCVLVEASLEDISRHRYRSQMEPKAALQSLFAFQIRYGTAFLFCGNRAGAEYACYSLLSKYLYELQRGFKRAIRSGHELITSNSSKEGKCIDE